MTRLRRQALPVTVLLLAVTAPLQGGDMLEPGDRFPDFTLTAHDGTTVASGDLAGCPYLVYFYPRANTPGCTREACELRDHWDEVRAAGLQVLGVSYDRPEDNAAFAQKHRLQFLLLSDSERRLAAAVGAKRALLPVPKRCSFLVGGDGTVLKVYPEVSPARHARQVLDDLAGLAR